MTRTIVICILSAVCAVMSAQTDRQHIRNGNRLYRQQKFDKAETDYRKAVDKNNKNPQAYYNLGCALMQQQKDSLAIVNLETAGKLETSKSRKAMVYHNIGVICQGHQMFQEAIDAYKESLRNNPKDDETRYNLALCQRQLKNQQKNNKDNKQNNKNDNDKNGNKDKQEQNDKNNQDKDKNKDKQNQKQNQPKEQMSKDNAEQLLQAALQEEKNTQQKMKKQQAMPQKRRLQKNW